MNIPTINGHCTSDRVLASNDVLLFTKDARTYAVLNMAAWKSEGMVLLVIDDKVCHDWADYMVHNYVRPGSDEKTNIH